MKRSKSIYVLVLALLVCAGTFVTSSSATIENPLPIGTSADRIIVEKSRHRLTLMNEQSVLKSYEVSLGRGGPGQKVREGDNRVPEGIYHIVGRNPQSHFHLALRVSYPEQHDVEFAHQKGYSPGGDIMVHGLRNGLGWLGHLHLLVDWTAGCIAVTNPEIEEIARVIPDGTTIEIKP